MAERNLKSKVLNGLFWKLLEQTGTQGVQFIVALILARLLSPEEYGTISLITIFITIANTFVQSGFATSLIQKMNIEDEDYSSVFWVTMLMSTLCYAVLYVSAPWLASFWVDEAEVLVKLLRLMGIVLFPGAVVSIQTAYAARNLQFRTLFKGTMCAVVISGVSAIFMAMQGFSYYAMAAQQIIYYFALMLVLFVLIKWHPLLVLSIERVKALFSFGWKILVSGLIDTVWMNIYGLVIGMKYSSADLGTYNRGEQFPKLITSNLSAAIQSVMLPAYARTQDDPDGLKRMCKRSVKLSAFIICPMMAGMFAVARPLIIILLTEKWIMAWPYLAIMCVSYAVWPLHVINLQIINAVGRSDLFLKLEIIKKILGIIVLVMSLPFGIWPMLIFKVLDEYVCTVINMWPNRKLINYGPLEQWKDVLPAFITSIIMGALTMSVQKLAMPVYATLLVQIIVGVVVYIILSLLINRESLYYVKDLAMKALKKSN